MDKIILNDMKFYGKHGCTSEERFKPQAFIIDAQLNLNLKPAGESDNLNDTVDYVVVKDIIQKIITGESKNLIESLAENIARELMKNFSTVESVKIKIYKPLSEAAVEIERGR